MTSNTGWKRVAAAQVPNCPAGKTCPIYDMTNPQNSSDYQYAMQMGHFLLKAGRVVRRGIILANGAPYDYAYARTSIGVNANGTKTWIVVADGEGVDGGHGATANQLGEFYRDHLVADRAMMIDSGESTELILRGVNGHRRVNIVSAENHADSAVGYDYCPSGRVYGYVKLGQ